MNDATKVVADVLARRSDGEQIRQDDPAWDDREAMRREACRGLLAEIDAFLRDKPAVLAGGPDWADIIAANFDETGLKP